MKIYIVIDYGIFSGDLDCSIDVFYTLQDAEKHLKERIEEILEYKEEDNIEFETDYKKHFWGRTNDWENEIQIQTINI